MQISPFYYFNADDSKKRQEVQTFEDYFTKELVPIRCDEESIVDSSESSTLLGLFPFHLAFHVHVNNPKATSGTSSSLREAPPNINGTTSLYFIENEALPTKRFSYLHGPGSLAFLGSSKSFTKLSSSYSRKNQQNLHEVGSPCFLEGDTTLMPILAKFQAFKHRYSVHLKGQVMQFKKNTWLIKGTIFRAKEHIGFFYQIMLLASDDQNLEEIYKEVRIPLSALALDINIYPTLHSDPLYTRSLLVKDHPLARVENLKSQLIGSSSKLLFHRSANIETFFNSYSLQYFFYLKLADIL